MNKLNKAELQLCYDIIDTNNPDNKPPKDNLDLNIVTIEIKKHLKSIPRVIHVDVYIDKVVITYIDDLPKIPLLLIPYLNGYRVIITFRLTHITTYDLD